MDSGIPSGSYVCCCYCVPYTVDESFWTSCSFNLSGAFAHAIGHGGVVDNYLTCTYAYIFGSWDTVKSPVCESRIGYSIRGIVEARQIFGGDCSTASVSGQYGGSASAVPTGYYGNQAWCYVPYDVCGGTTRSGFVNTFNVSTSLYVHTAYNKSYQCATASANINATLTLCVKVCNIVNCFCTVWCCEYIGNPASCEYRKFYSLTEVTASEEVLDPDGLINYMAVAYA